MGGIANPKVAQSMHAARSVPLVCRIQIQFQLIQQHVLTLYFKLKLKNQLQTILHFCLLKNNPRYFYFFELLPSLLQESGQKNMPQEQTNLTFLEL